MKHGIILCEFTGEVADAMRKRGLWFWSCDLLPGERLEGHIQGDALTALKRGCPWDAEPWQFAGLHWTCTWFTNAGVKWMYIDGHSRNGPDKGRSFHMHVSADRVCEILNWLLAHGIPFYFENPVMHHFAFDAIAERCPWFATAPMCSVQPWHFGTWETKRTCLWLHKLPPLVPQYRTTEECRIALGLPEFVMEDGVLVKNKPVAACHLASPGPNRGKDRSRTLPSLAKAMAEQ